MFPRPMRLERFVTAAVVGRGIANPPDWSGSILRVSIGLAICEKFAFNIDAFAGADVLVTMNSACGELPAGGEMGPSGCGKMKGNGCPRRGSAGSEVGAVVWSLS